MAVELLLDTGPLVAMLDRSDDHHRACVDVWRRWTGPILTTEAVITEATHLLGHLPDGRATCIQFALAGGVIPSPVTRARLERTEALMRKYADIPMDYADATLVVLAEELRTPHVFTVDRRGFETFRWSGRRTFTLHPGASS
jgi:hypothetical protein